MNERLYFDCNAMYGPYPKKPVEQRWTLDHLVEDLDLAGIAGALVFHAQCLHYDPMLTNRRLVADLRPHRSRLFPCWLAMPSVSGEFPGVASFLAEARDNGVRAFRVEPQGMGLPMTERVWGELRDAIVAQGSLVVTATTRWERDLTAVARTLEIFREARVLLVNHGWTQWRWIVCLMDQFPNLHIEFSSFQANRAIEYFAARYGAERCLFGTNLPEKAPGAARGFLDWTLLPEPEAAKVAGGNLRRLLGDVGPAAAPTPGRWSDALTAAARAGHALPCEIWDNHCHILHEGGSAAGNTLVMHRGDADGMIELTRRIGIRKTAIMSWAGPVSADADLGNEVVAKAVAKYPDEFIGLATVNPEHQSPAEIEDVIRKYHVGLRFPGLKALTSSLTINYDDPLFERWYAFGNEHHLYAVIDPCGSTDDAPMERLARQYPNLALTLDHCGQSWPYARWVARLGAQFPNVYAQLNYTAVTNGTIEYLVREMGADRVLFGTDAPMRDPRPQVGWLVFTRLSEADKRQVFGLNFKRILDRAWSDGGPRP